MSVLSMRQGLPNFFLDGKNSYSANFKSIEAILEPYDQLNAENEIPCSFDIKVTVSNSKGSTDSIS
jgi:hypothetical protein